MTRTNFPYTDSMRRVDRPRPEAVGDRLTARQRALRVMRGPFSVPAVTWAQDVASAVIDRMGTSRAFILGKSQNRADTTARQVCWLVMRYGLSPYQSTSFIAACFGRDHSTIFSGLDRIVEVAKRNPRLAQIIAVVEDDLREGGWECGDTLRTGDAYIRKRINAQKASAKERSK